MEVPANGPPLPPRDLRNPHLGKEVYVINHSHFRGCFGYVTNVSRIGFIVGLEASNSYYDFEAKYLVDLWVTIHYSSHLYAHYVLLANQVKP